MILPYIINMRQLALAALGSYRFPYRRYVRSLGPCGCYLGNRGPVSGYVRYREPVEDLTNFKCACDSGDRDICVNG
jgi:hypothetical protein